MKRNIKERIGTCKLTKKHGSFIKSHLIPQAFTKPIYKNGFMQRGFEKRPIKRWSSWYDMHLVTKEGEDILTEFDTWAISEFRKHKLVWSSWGQNRFLGSLHHQLGNTQFGIRKIEGIDPKKLRLFFLSLLWRAAATDLPEFCEVQLPEKDLERLRLMILARETKPIFFYPAQIVQFSSIGDFHNRTPIQEIKMIKEDRCLPIFRFYFDGLITHIYRQISNDDFISNVGSFIVGASDTLSFLTIAYDDSREEYDMMNVLVDNKIREIPDFPYEESKRQRVGWSKTAYE